MSVGRHRSVIHRLANWFFPRCGTRQSVTSYFLVVVCFMGKKRSEDCGVKKKQRRKKGRQTHRYEIVAVPPEQLSILNEDGTSHIPHYILGPYTEGASLNITCDATGGKYSCFTYPSLPVSPRSFSCFARSTSSISSICVFLWKRVHANVFSNSTFSNISM